MDIDSTTEYISSGMNAFTSPEPHLRAALRFKTAAPAIPLEPDTIPTLP